MFGMGLLRCSVPALIVFYVLLSAFPAAAGPIELLPGRWSGWGTIDLTDGNSEKVKCVATYFVEGGGKNVRQNLRCASAGYQIASKAKLQVRNRSLTGDWQESNYETQGSMSGRLTDSGMVLLISSNTFKARLTVKISRCRQSVQIVPRDHALARLAVRLDRNDMRACRE